MLNDASHSASPQPEETERVFRQLCHLLSLDRNGKVQGAVESLIMTILYIDPRVGASADPGELALAIATYFGVEIDVAAVKAAVERHIQNGQLLIDRSTTPHQVTLAPDIRADVARRIEEAAQLEATVRADWLRQIDSTAGDIDPNALWQALQHYLGLVFRQHGVEAVQLLDASASGSPNEAALASMLEQVIQKADLVDHQSAVKQGIAAFFRDTGPARLRYMSELLDGAFTFFALTVGDATAEYLKSQLPPLRLFLDTNVVLGVLGLHDNPLQATCDELLATIENGHYPFQLYCHERTLRELSEISDADKARLSTKRYSPQLSKAYVQWGETHNEFGVEMRFHRLNAAGEIDVAAFLARFDHIEELLAAKKITIYRQAGPDLDTMTKGAYIAEFEHFLQQRRPGRPRRYEALDHDVTLWMYLQRLRSSSKSALRAGALVLSHDLALHSFDKNFLMNQSDAKGAATVVLPQHLLQVLRPLNPSKADYDEQFLAIFAVPEFRSAQSGYDATAANVMKYLASFDDVPKETAVLILNDDLLMGRLGDIDTQVAECARLIEDAVLAENAGLVEHMASLQGQLDEAETTLSQRAESAKTEIDALKQQTEEVGRQEEAAKVLAIEEAAKREKAEQELAAERARREGAEALVAGGQAARATMIRRLRWTSSCLTGAIGVLLILRGPDWIGWISFLRLHTHVAVQALVSLAWLGLAYTLAPTKHRGTVMIGVVAAAIIAALTLI